MTDINALKYLNLSTRKKDKMKENIKRLTWKKKKKQWTILEIKFKGIKI